MLGQYSGLEHPLMSPHLFLLGQPSASNQGGTDVGLLNVSDRQHDGSDNMPTRALRRTPRWSGASISHQPNSPLTLTALGSARRAHLFSRIHQGNKGRWCSLWEPTAQWEPRPLTPPKSMLSQPAVDMRSMAWCVGSLDTSPRSRLGAFEPLPHSSGGNDLSVFSLAPRTPDKLHLHGVHRASPLVRLAFSGHGTLAWHSPFGVTWTPRQDSIP